MEIVLEPGRVIKSITLSDFPLFFPFTSFMIII